jgi:hypothetical protein
MHGQVDERTFVAGVETVPEIIGFVAAAAEAWGAHPRRLMQL